MDIGAMMVKVRVQKEDERRDRTLNERRSKRRGRKTYIPDPGAGLIWLRNVGWVRASTRKADG